MRKSYSPCNYINNKMTKNNSHCEVYEIIP